MEGIFSDKSTFFGFIRLRKIQLALRRSTWKTSLKLIIVQRDATQSSLFIILQVDSTCFGCQPHPSSGVHKSVTTAYSTEQLLPFNLAKLATLDVGSCTVPEAVVTGLCNPDDGCGWPPKHVEWTCRIINRLLCVASRWTIIDKVQRCTEPKTKNPFKYQGRMYNRLPTSCVLLTIRQSIVLKEGVFSKHNTSSSKL